MDTSLMDIVLEIQLDTFAFSFKNEITFYFDGNVVRLFKRLS